MQYKKQGINLSVFLVLTFVNIWRGSKSSSSVFGVETCSIEDWFSLVIFLIYCIIVSTIGVKQTQHEQYLKIKYGTGLANSDIKLEGSNLIKLIGFSYVGGFVSGAFGLGGGAIFNPLLLSFGVPPKVASSTGMYMIIFATCSSCIQYYINNMLILNYGIWVGLWCIFGTYAGMKLIDKLMKKWDRQSPLVFLLSFILGISATAVLYFGLADLDLQADSTYSFGNICK